MRCWTKPVNACDGRAGMTSTRSLFEKYRIMPTSVSSFFCCCPLGSESAGFGWNRLRGFAAPRSLKISAACCDEKRTPAFSACKMSWSIRAVWIAACRSVIPRY